MTPRKTAFPVAFALASSETEEAFIRLNRQLRDLFQEAGLLLTGRHRHVKVIITDNDAGLKTALSQVFPEVQQQICLWHIQKNVLKNVADKWVSPPRANMEEPQDQSAVSLHPTDLARQNGPQLQGQANLSVEHTQSGLLKMWKAVCWARNVATIREKWTALCEEFEPDQHGM